MWNTQMYFKMTMILNSVIGVNKLLILQNPTYSYLYEQAAKKLIEFKLVCLRGKRKKFKI